MRRRAALLAVMLPAIMAGMMTAQAPLSGLGRNPGASRPSKATAAVEYLYPEQVTVAAGRPVLVKLHFRVSPGLHINSHTPRDAQLIATALTLPEGSGVKLAGAVYPRGESFALPADPKTKLDVYTGEFTIEARLVAAPGDHLVEARLRYQACDNAACMPPKTLVAAIDVLAQ